VLLANLLGDRLLFGRGLGSQANALDRLGHLVHHRSLLREHHLVLLLRDVRPVRGSVDVALRDRFPLDHGPLLADRHGVRLHLGRDVLAESGPAGLLGGGADTDPLLRARHASSVVGPDVS